jgi:hypothetical protein
LNVDACMIGIMDGRNEKKEENVFHQPSIAERVKSDSVGREEQEMGALTDFPAHLPGNSQKPVSFFGWGLVFVAGAFVWTALFYWLA